MARRVIRSLVRRAAEGDTEALEQLADLDRVVSAAVAEALALMHGEAGYSYGELAAVLGVSRQAVLKRAQPRRPEPGITRGALNEALR
jgi:DNA-directed RNA polymerase specialized sigma24 family protein